MNIYGETFAEDEYDLTKQRIQQLEDAIEIKNQQNHEIKNKISLGIMLETDYVNELETLRLNGIQNESKLHKQIQKLEESLRSFDNSLDGDDQIDLISELEKKKIELEELINNQNLNESITSETLNNSLIEEGRQLKYKLIQAQESNDSLQSQYEALQVKNAELQAIINDKSETITHKNQELFDIKKRINYLQEECKAIKQLVSHKTKPLNASKQGNSLFAEVHDSEKKLGTSIAKLERHHRELKARLHLKKQQISTLCAENLKQSSILDTIEEYDIMNDAHIKELKSEISALQLEMKEQKVEIQKDFQLTGKELNKDMLYFAKETLKEKWYDIVTDIELLNKSYIYKLEVAVKLIQTDVNLRKITRKILQLKVQHENLENILSDLQCELKKCCENGKVPNQSDEREVNVDTNLSSINGDKKNVPIINVVGTDKQMEISSSTSRLIFSDGEIANQRSLNISPEIKIDKNTLKNTAIQENNNPKCKVEDETIGENVKLTDNKTKSFDVIKSGTMEMDSVIEKFNNLNVFEDKENVNLNIITDGVLNVDNIPEVKLEVKEIQDSTESEYTSPNFKFQSGMVKNYYMLTSNVLNTTNSPTFNY